MLGPLPYVTFLELYRRATEFGTTPTDSPAWTWTQVPVESIEETTNPDGTTTISIRTEPQLMRTNAFSWVHEATRYDLDAAISDYGRWFDAKVQERTKGKHPKPMYEPAVLLGIKQKPTKGKTVEDPRTGKVYANPMGLVTQFRGQGGIEGMGLITRTVPPPASQTD